MIKRFKQWHNRNLGNIGAVLMIVAMGLWFFWMVYELHHG
jgi:hypothetical protein